MARKLARALGPVYRRGLLRWLKVPLTREAYHRLVGRLFPEAAANLLLAQDGWRAAEPSCRDDRHRLRRALCAPSANPRGEEPFVSTWRAVAGPAPGSDEAPEDRYIARHRWRLVVSLLPRLASGEGHARRGGRAMDRRARVHRTAAGRSRREPVTTPIRIDPDAEMDPVPAAAEAPASFVAESTAT